jgi:hypothetical protein
VQLPASCRPKTTNQQDDRITAGTSCSAAAFHLPHQSELFCNAVTQQLLLLQHLQQHLLGCMCGQCGAVAAQQLLSCHAAGNCFNWVHAAASLAYMHTMYNFKGEINQTGKPCSGCADMYAAAAGLSSSCGDAAAVLACCCAAAFLLTFKRVLLFMLLLLPLFLLLLLLLCIITTTSLLCSCMVLLLSQLLAESLIFLIHLVDGGFNKEQYVQVIEQALCCI